MWSTELGHSTEAVGRGRLDVRESVRSCTRHGRQLEKRGKRAFMECRDNLLEAVQVFPRRVIVVVKQVILQTVVIAGV